MTIAPRLRVAPLVLATTFCVPGAYGQGLLTPHVIKAKGCDAASLGTARELTFEQRACYYTDQLLKPSMAVRAFGVSGFDLLRDSPREQADGVGSLGQRFSIFYARHAAQSAGELVAGYFNHEDPRFQSSDQDGVWKRTKGALLNVMVNRTPDSHTRVALAPIAGAFAAGFVGMGCYPMEGRMREGLLWTGAAYGGTLGTALLREFKPDLVRFLARHRKEPSLSEP